jgi:hypothetical protein
MGIYTINASTASLASSASRVIQYNSTAAASSYSVVSGTRYWTVGLGTWDMTPGQYLMAVNAICTSSGTSGTISIFGRTANSIGLEQFGSGDYNGWGIGVYGTTFNSNCPNSMHITNVVQTGNSVVRQPWYNFFGTF